MSRARQLLEKFDPYSPALTGLSRKTTDKIKHKALAAHGGPTLDAAKAAQKSAIEKGKEAAAKLASTRHTVKKVTSPSPSASDIVKGSHIPSSGKVHSAGHTVSSVASDPSAAKKAFHTAVGAAAVGGAAYLAARRRKKRREREASYRGSSHYDD